MAAIGKQTGSVGNIPGPDSPFTAATGMLFSPLAALAANLIQEAIRSKLSKRQLLEIDLANSDEPDDDPFSLSDEEKAVPYGYKMDEAGYEEEVGY